MTKDQPIQVANYTISPAHRPFLIAEMSGNHNQSLDRALEIVDAVADAGAHALKLQTYTPDTITFNGASEEFYIRDAKSLWADKNLYKLYAEAYTPWEWHKPIFDHAKKRGMIAFSSPFDTTAVDFLESLDVPLYKIASFENTDHILLKKVAQTGKPVIMSTGVASVADLDESVKDSGPWLQRPGAVEVYEHLSRYTRNDEPPHHSAHAAVIRRTGWPFRSHNGYWRGCSGRGVRSRCAGKTRHLTSSRWGC